MFNKAKNVTVNGGSFVANAGSPPSLDRLIAEVAPNAILNAGGRADEVRCFPGTRKEVIRRLEKFMDDNTPGKKRMMWLSGPAGAGKSAICQTLAERRSEHERHAANFFFLRGDSTRSHSKPLVATLVYQLRHFYPALDKPLSNYLQTNPLICSSSIEAQFNQLISFPVQTIQQSTSIQQQIVIIIDGLDECNETREQDQILVALHTLAHAEHSPFLILVSSRAEPQLVMFFNRLGSSVESIFLNEDYRPQEDIRRFVIAKFSEIKQNHFLAQTLSKNWPPAADIRAIINKSSGHFIYAATVMRFIECSSESPALSLVTIIEMPPSIDRSPFAHLDAIYSYIFSKVHNIRAVKLVLFARDCANYKTEYGTEIFRNLLELVGYKDIVVQSFFADLAAIIKVVPGSKDPLEFYHASLEDYLNDKSRSTIYYVNEDEISVEFSLMCLRNIRDSYSIWLSGRSLSRVHKPTPELFNSLLDASTRCLTVNYNQTAFVGDLIGHIERLYWPEHNKDQFKVLLQSWSNFVYINNLDKFSHGNIQPQNPLASPYYTKYWMTKRYNKHELPTTNSSTPTTEARSNAQITHAKASPNVAIGHLVDGLRVRKPGASPKNVRKAPPKGSGGGSLRRKAMRLQPGGTSRAIIAYEDKEDEYSSGEYDDGSNELSMIWVKIHYQDDVRTMPLSPETPFEEFVDKVTVKFGKDFNTLTLRFKDDDGSEITLRDDSEYELAIETARESSNGKTKGKLEMWCQDSAR